MTANIELEQRVHDRTIRLNLVVDQLRREIVERQLAQQQLADREASLMDAQEIAELGSSRGECLGLSGMQQRVHLADGQLEIDSSREDGTTIHAWFPLT